MKKVLEKIVFEELNLNKDGIAHYYLTEKWK